MGSKSDYPVVQKAEQMLENFGVEYETRIISAHRTPKQAEQFAADAEGQRLWLHHSSGRQSCAPGGSPGGNDAAAGDRYTDEIKHYGRTRFASFRGADAKRSAGRNSCDRRRGKRSAAGSPDPEHSRSGAQRSHQGFQEKSRKKKSSRSTANSTNRRTDNMNDTQEV